MVPRQPVKLLKPLKRFIEILCFKILSNATSGGEEQLLRAQIARITSTCMLAPKGYFEARILSTGTWVESLCLACWQVLWVTCVEVPIFFSVSDRQVDEEAPVKNTIRMVEGALDAFPSPEEFLIRNEHRTLQLLKHEGNMLETWETWNLCCFLNTLDLQELATQGGWVHASPFLLSTGTLSKKHCIGRVLLRKRDSTSAFFLEQLSATGSILIGMSLAVQSTRKSLWLWSLEHSIYKKMKVLAAIHEIAISSTLLPFSSQLIIMNHVFIREFKASLEMRNGRFCVSNCHELSPLLALNALMVKEL